MEGESARKGRVLRLPDVKAITGLGRSSIYNRMKRSSKYHDPTFPSRIQIGERAMGWYEEDVLRWIASRPKQSAKRPAQAAEVAAPPGKRAAQLDEAGRVAGAQRAGPIATTKAFDDRTGRVSKRVRLAIQSVLADLSREGSTASAAKFNELLRARTGDTSHIPDELLDDVDLVAYRANQLFPTVVIQESESPLDRLRRLASTVGVELSRAQVKAQRIGLFLAQISPRDPKPIGFRWISVKGAALVLTPIYERSGVGAGVDRTAEARERAAAVKACYADLIERDTVNARYADLVEKDK